jgi:hypothetical protein
METRSSQLMGEVSHPDAREFFLECARLDVSVRMIHWILEQCAGDAPSFESLLQWRRGVPPPPFTRFDDWLALIRLSVGEEIDR